jgi:beta-glucosidase
LPRDQVARIIDLTERLPVVLVVSMTRPAILTPVAGAVAAVVADFGASDEAVIAALSGTMPPEGSLPFELPRSMAAVAASREDVASDTVNPLFTAGSSIRFISLPSVSHEENHE